MNTTITKMKEEDDDRHKHINERITSMYRKIFDVDEKCENRRVERRRAHEDQNQGKAVVTGFHSETSESEVDKLLKETITEMGMSIENARIELVCKTNYTCLHPLQERRRKTQIRQISEHVEKRAERKEDKDNSIKGR